MSARDWRDVDWLAPVRKWPGLCSYECAMPFLMRGPKLGRPRSTSDPAGGWGTGLVSMPNTPHGVAPDWMPKRRAP
jgi:hypothetical protein